MGGNTFHIQGFSLSQEGCGMRISTDGILLAAWAMPSVCPARAIDLGAGTGLIAFLLAKRFPSLPIDAFEIDPSSASCLRRNLENYPYSHSIRVIEGNFVTLYPKCYATSVVDLIVCNPPYYSEGPSTRNPSRELARYSRSLATSEIFESAAYLLPSEGKLAMITPYDQRNRLITEAYSRGLRLSRAMAVITIEGKAPKRLLSEWIPSCEGSLGSISQLDTLTIRNRDNSYTDEYASYVAPYYLKERKKE